MLTVGRFSPANLSPQPTIPGYDELLNKLQQDDSARFSFLKACLEKLGLEPSAENATLPTLSNIHLSAVDNSQVSELVHSWGEVIDKENGEEFISGEGDKFRIQSDEDGLALQDLLQSLPTDEHATGETGIVDYSTITKNIIAHEKALPSAEMTPRFNHKLYYSSLRRFQLIEDSAVDWGNVLMYGDVVTSTNSLLEK
jgi:biotin--protein ligase